MANLQSGVYRIQNITTGEFYIGSTVNFNTRLNNHFSFLRRNKHHNYRLQNAFNRRDCLVFGIVEECSSEQTAQREQFYLDTSHPHYNIAKTVEKPNLGRSLSEETKQKIGKANSVNRLSPEHFQKFRKASEEYMSANHPMRGKKHSEETKKKMRESRKKYFERLHEVGLKQKPNSGSFGSPLRTRKAV